MKVLGSNTQAVKPALREMGRSNLIANVSDWILYVDARNESSHTYDESVAIRVFVVVRNFVPDIRKLQIALKKVSP